MKDVIKKALPQAEKTKLHLGYMRLSDSASLVMAEALGLFEKYELDVELHREVSWANIRDKVIAGTFDASQMLAPMPLVTTFGAAGIRAPMVTGLVMSLNGNGITLSRSLLDQIQTVAGSSPIPFDNAKEVAIALGKVVKICRDQQPLTFATVHSFSTHTILLRKWLQAGGVDPNHDVRIIVLPPEQMVDSLAQGVIDGFCVGEPWNTIAVEYGAGVITTTGFQVWNNAPEKVLGVLEDWHIRHPATHLRLRLALMESCHWLADMENRQHTIEVLSQPQYLDLPASYLQPSLTGYIQRDRVNQTPPHRDFHVFSRYNAGFPWRSQAELLLNYCGEVLGRAVDAVKLKELSQRCFRTDLYREAARLLDIPAPQQDFKKEGVHSSPWYFEQDIELGSDLMLSPDSTNSPQ